MKTKDLICPDCGKELKNVDITRQRCFECAAERARLLNLESKRRARASEKAENTQRTRKKQHVSAESQIAAIAREARAHGMSYGKWVACHG